MDEDRINRIDSDFLSALLFVLESHGLEEWPVYIVGGWVRDKLLGNPSNDVDLIINHRIFDHVAKELCDNMNFVDLKFESIIFKKLDIGQCKGLRSCNIKYKHEENSYVIDLREIKDNSSIEDDIKTRDFTINSLYFDTQTFEIIGRKQAFDDIDRKVLRTVQEPRITFEDERRLFRLIRMTGLEGFTVAEELQKYVKNVSKTQLKQRLKNNLSRMTAGEFGKIVKRKNSSKAVKFILETDFFKFFTRLDPHKESAYNIEREFQFIKQSFIKSIPLLDMIEKLVSIEWFCKALKKQFKEDINFSLRRMKTTALGLELFKEDVKYNFKSLLLDFKIKENVIDEIYITLDEIEKKERNCSSFKEFQRYCLKEMKNEEKHLIPFLSYIDCCMGRDLAFNDIQDSLRLRFIE